MNEVELTALPVLECTQVPVIVENLMDMAASYQAKLAYIETLPRDDEGMKTVKALRAEARKEFEALDERRLDHRGTYSIRRKQNAQSQAVTYGKTRHSCRLL